MNNASLLASTLALLAACGTDESPADMPSPELGVSSVSSARVIRGRVVDVPIEIVRNASLVGPVTIEVSGLPAGVVAMPLAIADGETTGTLKLDANADIALGTQLMVTLRATAGDTVAEAAMQLRLTDRPGSLDKTFGVGGIVSRNYSGSNPEALAEVLVQPDGKIVAAGINSGFVMTIATRFNADGSVDKEFGDGGTYPGPINMEAVVGMGLRPDGTILIVAHEPDSTNIHMLASSGYLQETLVLSAANTGADFSARSVLAMPDGSMYLVGNRGDKNAVVRLTVDGALDPAFDGDGVALLDFGFPTEPTSLFRRPDGRLVVTGWSQVLSSTVYAAAQLNADGSPDTSFSGDGIARFDTAPEGGFAAANLLPDGRIAAVGFDAMQKVSLLHIETDGSMNMANKLPMDMNPFAAVPVTEGVLVVGSNMDMTEWHATKFNNAGLDTDFGVDGVLQTRVPSGAEHNLMSAVQVDTDRAVAVGATVVNNVAQQSVIRFWL